MVRREGFEPPAFWSVGCLTHKSESFRLRFVLFATVRSADFPLFPSSPAHSHSILGQKWVRHDFTAVRSGSPLLNFLPLRYSISISNNCTDFSMRVISSPANCISGKYIMANCLSYVMASGPLFVRQHRPNTMTLCISGEAYLITGASALIFCSAFAS